MHIHYKDLYFTYRLLSYTYSMAHPSDFVINIPDKTTTVISWHQMDTHSQVVLDTRLVLEVLRRSFTVFTIYGYSTEFAILRVLIDILLTVDHGDFNLLSDVTSSCTVASYTQTSTKMHLIISHFPVRGWRV